MDLDKIREDILAGRPPAPEVLFKAIEKIRQERVEASSKRIAKKEAKGNISHAQAIAELNASLNLK